MGTAAFHNPFAVPDYSPRPEENPICEALLQIVEGRRYIDPTDTDKPPAPSTLRGKPIIENPTLFDGNGTGRQNGSLTQTASLCKKGKSRSGITVAGETAVGQANSAKALPEIPSVNHYAIISTLRAWNGKVITADFGYINKELSAGFASFSPGGSRLRIQVHFRKDLSNSGLPLHTLQKKYAISGNLLFDDDAMVKKVISMPARCFLAEAQQHTPPNPIHLAKNSIKIFKKDSTIQHLLHIPILTKGQQKVYNTITSLFNKLLDTDIVSLKGTPRAKSTLQGQACCHLKSGQLLFISFKIPATAIDQRVDPSAYLKQGKIRGRLRYDPKWLFSKISNNSTILHSSHPGILPNENKIFFPANSITLYFEDPSHSSTS